MKNVIDDRLARKKMMFIALECLAAGELGTAASICKGLTAIEPQSLAPSLVLCLIDYSLDQRAIALRQLKQLAIAFPESGDLIQSLYACLLVQSGKKTEAMRLLKQLALRTEVMKEDAIVTAFVTSLLTNELNCKTGENHGTGNPACAPVH